VREGELDAVSFDPEHLTLRGAPRAMVEGVFRAPDAGGAYFAVAANGTLIYSVGGYGRTLVQVTPHGKRTPLLEERRGFRTPALSPDGRAVAVTIDPRPSQIWVYDLVRKSRVALSDDAHSLVPLWTPDGRRITFTTQGIVWRAADAGSPPERLIVRDAPAFPTSWSPDGKQLVFHEGVANAYDIWVLPVGEAPRPLVVTAANELGGRLSPDGRWLAYHSNESGRFEVYVRPFPTIDGGKWPISISGGQHAHWSPDGSAIFYAAGPTMMRVPIAVQGDRIAAGTPETLFSGPFDTGYTGYAVAKNGDFVMVEIDPEARPTRVQVVVGWGSETARLVPPPR
jgi:serine/threonine-protein kinase